MSPQVAPVSSPVALMLSRLEGVRRSGGGWTARCPAHADRSPSLSITEAETGAALIHCYTGCETAAVVAAVGLTMSDLFPRTRKPSGADLSPQQRAERRLLARQSQWAAALRVLDYEAAVVQAAVVMYRRGETISAEDAARLDLAAQRIADARLALGGRG